MGPLAQPSVTDPTPGSGKVPALAGKKTYLAALVTAVIGVLVAKAESHLPGVGVALIERYKGAIELWAIAAIATTGRAAIAKIEDKLNAVLKSYGINIS